ncbi:hypothetical protein [Alkalicoccobacillus plakortidis]|uniref:Uncharacterized protein n=1 Tax=Alkalicoccobacillus plakortidis TaxID=444060 RepID=A0ABT0XM75_9BACI|nr:hypothetical protein [Alkalicoccobacillus plakortidis]MCM2677006.1 hypothetical protein [Alkalicoccobacillus plakortidis]
MNKLYVWIPLFCMVCLIASISSEPTNNIETEQYTNSYQIDEESQIQTVSDINPTKNELDDTVGTETVLTIKKHSMDDRKHLVYSWSTVTKKKTKVVYEEL